MCPDASKTFIWTRLGEKITSKNKELRSVKVALHIITTFALSSFKIIDSGAFFYFYVINDWCITDLYRLIKDISVRKKIMVFQNI